MNRKGLIDKIANDAGITKKAANAALKSFLDGVKESLVNREKVSLVGFGSFKVKTRKARKGINPQTKEPLQIPERDVPVFKAGKNLKEAVKESK